MNLPSPSFQVEIRATPRSSRRRIDATDERWKVWVTEPPIDGLANTAVIEAIAKALGVPRASVTLLRGESSRSKLIRIEGITREEAHARLGAPRLF